MQDECTGPPVEQLDVQRHAVAVRRDAKPGKALAALDHRAHRRDLETVEVRDAGRIGVIGPAQPERLQALAHGAVGVNRLRLDPGADQTIDRDGNPGLLRAYQPAYRAAVVAPARIDAFRPSTVRAPSLRRPPPRPPRRRRAPCLCRTTP